MGLRFFADHCVPDTVIRGLRNAGHEVYNLKSLIPVESPDSVVISKAQEIDSILVSLNGDFADSLNYPPHLFRGIISLQVRNHPEVIPALMNRLLSYLALHPEMGFYRQKLFLAEAHRIRIRG